MKLDPVTITWYQNPYDLKTHYGSMDEVKKEEEEEVWLKKLEVQAQAEKTKGKSQLG